MWVGEEMLLAGGLEGLEAPWIFGFATEITLLLKRYSCEEDEDSKSSALHNHWTLLPEIMKALQQAFGIPAEAFASPLNLGSFECNPEYTAQDLDKALCGALMSTAADSPVLGIGL
ncbi:hypothetical protein CYMTET_28928 [Cymbomonas tetramitiformis]|uniref:Uncharacterized protein n=1 Tax=Cymbomonas tetramitiformis TaxID=36881 RepID=A0AAE0KVG7_9CHLO|nr:hypothetical protein CYMTET_28928 [Cymbomonas tetramitiformis]